VAAILQGKIDAAGLSAAERALLGYAKLITEAAHRSSGEDVQKLRDLGWKEEQIAESVYIRLLQQGGGCFRRPLIELSGRCVRN